LNALLVKEPRSFTETIAAQEIQTAGQGVIYKIEGNCPHPRDSDREPHRTSLNLKAVDGDFRSV